MPAFGRVRGSFRHNQSYATRVKTESYGNFDVPLSLLPELQNRPTLATRGGRLLAKEAARGKTRTRLRPILGTSFAVMLGVAPLAVTTGELRSDIGLRRDADKRNDRLTSEKDLRSRRQGDDPDPRSADRTRRRAFSLTLLSTRTRTPSGRSLADTEDRPPGSRLEEFFDRKLVARLPRHCPRPIKRRGNSK
jgi:hypothetical protein